MIKKAATDLVILAIVFSCTWYFRTYFPIEFRGSFVVLSTALIGVILIKLRQESFREIGFVSFSLNSKFFGEVVQVSFLIFAVQFIGIITVGSLLGTPDQGTAITSQPQTISGFILDIILMTWLVTGFGEEFIFRGIILNRFKRLFKSIGISNIYILSAGQAIWFGLGHQSQGLSGVVITGLIGFALGIYLLKRSEFGLWPLVVAHGIVDTVVLTISFIFNS